ncbi:hypothetical protein RhiirC2_782889 [Rhizophagus irregularis]|uniref:Uncharacterized protein n=1 Tax=Rhizophagus irregularis TaxID=588596 RepID=A0A2N1N250_9GLOM|nr:hypothetical protein RhiirC2_782889 [Rhizophagus irregularis]
MQSGTAKRSNEPNVSLERDRKFILLAELTFTNLSKTCFWLFDTFRSVAIEQLRVYVALGKNSMLTWTWKDAASFSEYSQQNCGCGEALVDNEPADQLTKSN